MNALSIERILSLMVRKHTPISLRSGLPKKPAGRGTPQQACCLITQRAASPQSFQLILIFSPMSVALPSHFQL
jgi:hypothetical protein